MNASEIIEELKRMIEIHGDVPVKCVTYNGDIRGQDIVDVRYSIGDISQKPSIKILADV